MILDESYLIFVSMINKTQKFFQAYTIFQRLMTMHLFKHTAIYSYALHVLIKGVHILHEVRFIKL